MGEQDDVQHDGDQDDGFMALNERAVKALERAAGAFERIADAQALLAAPAADLLKEVPGLLAAVRGDVGIAQVASRPEPEPQVMPPPPPEQLSRAYQRAASLNPGVNRGRR